ncbi:SMI1/KNR4 family protein [Corallococcus aberystwythensis]|uniref:SMI1/KNR4 family protein n=1 Tax=Corallococcus aberystwythensis TaxID=2316722 RepID=A0A3A8PI94_9BACT|nr:SMI1/KNR4 family protein [Corallococcus aberystwythensis]RKH55739.1 SMI1/KNR4 family protein [Corallococcus aberystwythensis]
MPMKDLLTEVSRLHFPRPPATAEQVAAFEKRVGWRLDEDLRAFYLHCNGATLFAPLPDVNYHLLPLERIERARVAILGRDEDSAGAATHYCVVDMQDGDYVFVDVAQEANGRLPLFDAWHETYPQVKRIASSFEEFLEKALRSGNRSFWLSGSPP